MAKRQSLSAGLSETLARKFVADPNSVMVSMDGSEDLPQSSPQTILTEKIKLPLKQPRRYFDPMKQDQLTESIREHGILEPLLIRLLQDDTYELVAGERRYRSAQALQLKEVPVIIKQLDDRQAMQIALIENLQRDDLNAIDETEAILELLAIEIDGTVEEVTSILHRANHAKNRSQELKENVFLRFKTIEKTLLGLGRFSAESFRTSRLPLLNLPGDILKALQEGKLEFTKARAIAQVKDEASNNLSLRQIKDLIAVTKSEANPEHEPSMVDRFNQAVRAITQAKPWNDPKKRRKLDKLILEMESLLED
jgi:ParB family transcriptional regulator, chromosome partitioning protein